RVQVVRGEVGVGRVVRVDAPDVRVGEQHAAAAIRLEPVLVRVYDDRVGARHGREWLAPYARIAAVGQEREEAAVRGVDVQPRAVLRAQVRDRGDVVNRTETRRAERRDYGADAAGTQSFGQRAGVQPAELVLRDLLVR